MYIAYFELDVKLLFRINRVLKISYVQKGENVVLWAHDGTRHEEKNTNGIPYKHQEPS